MTNREPRQAGRRAGRAGELLLAAGIVLVALGPAERARAQPYTWQVSDWSACSVACGGGTQARAVWCVDEGTGAVVSDASCTSSRPASARSCNEAPCPTFSWQVSDWSACSVACGGGTQARAVTCVSDATGAVVPDASCTSPRPASARSCNEAPCPSYSWQVSDWSACSVACGGGTQARTVTCVSDATGAVVPDASCTSPRPVSAQSCNEAPCPSYSWQVSDWSACSVACGGGTRARSVVCVSGATGAVVPDSLCTDARPSEAQACGEEPCEVDAGAPEDAGSDTDAGASGDAGIDSGPDDAGIDTDAAIADAGTDGGPADAGLDADASIGDDAGRDLTDAGAAPLDSGADPPATSGGCSCAAGGRRGARGAVLALVLGLALLHRRRRRVQGTP